MLIDSLVRLLGESRASKVVLGHPQDPRTASFFSADPPIAGVDVDEQSTFTHSPFWRAVNVLASNVGALPLFPYRRLNDGGKVRAVDHRTYDLLRNRPNLYMTAITFRETMQGHVLTWGNGYAEIELRGDGSPAALWPLHPGRVTPRVVDGELVYEVLPSQGPIVTLQPWQVLHIAGLGFDGLRGYPVIQIARESIAAGLAVEKFGAAWFGKGSRPSGVFTHPGTLSETAHKNLKASMESEFSGLDNAHRLAILEEGVSWQQIGIPPEDAQFLQTKRFGVEEVSRWTGVPPYKLYELSQSSVRANIEHQSLEFYTDSLLPWLVRWEQELGFKLYGMRDRARYFVEFLVDNVLRADIETRYKAYQIGLSWGITNVNEVRAKENMNPIGPDGDKHFVPMNMIPLEEAVKMQAPVNPGAEAAPGDGRAVVTDGDLIRRIAEHKQLALPAQGTEPLSPAMDAKKRLTESFLPVFVDADERLVRKERMAITKAAKKLLPTGKVDEFGAWLNKFYDEHCGAIRAAIGPGVMALARATIAEGVEVDCRISSAANKHREICERQMRAAVDDMPTLEAVVAKLDEWKDSRPSTSAACWLKTLGGN